MPTPEAFLILGGTLEARQLAYRLKETFVDLPMMLSLAGRTQTPIRQPIPTRRGGFGGTAGLADWLKHHAITRLIVATHPFAAQMPWHAVDAAQRSGIAVYGLLRDAWHPQPGDDWITCPSIEQAPALLGTTAQRVFLPLGRQSIAPFIAAPQHHYLIRTIEPLTDSLPLPHQATLNARGPFSIASELDLLKRWGISRLVCKNSGGDAMAAKLEAARRLHLPVIMIERPPRPAYLPTFTTPEALIHALSHAMTSH